MDIIDVDMSVCDSERQTAIMDGKKWLQLMAKERIRLTANNDLN